MGRPRKSGNGKRNAGGLYDPHLVTAFGYLARSRGISIAEAIRRLMVTALINKHIPGVEPLDYAELNANMPFEHTKAAPPSSDGEVLFERPEQAPRSK